MGPRSMSHTTSEFYQEDNSFYEGDGPRPTLHHSKSAKLLIDQYETMHDDDITSRPFPPDMRGPSRSTRTAQRRPSPSNALLSSSNVVRHRSTPATTFNATASASFYPSSSNSHSHSHPNSNKKDSSTVPLRHSFKNLLSLLKKGKNGLMGPSEKDKVIFPTAAAMANKKSAALAEEHKQLPLLPIPLGDAQRPALSRSQTQMGALIYLTRYNPAGLDLSDEYSMAGVPLWASCTITLNGSTIGVSWFTPEGIPCARDIELVGCSDIRSVSSDLRALEPEEREALPGSHEAGGGGEPLKVFELLFKDRRPPERFAVASVRERAKWISAFWDAMLSPSSEAAESLPNDGVHRRSKEAKVPDRREKRRPTSQPVTRPSPPTPIRTNTERSLPPIPVSRTLSSQPREMPVVPPLSIPSKSGASLRTTKPMTRTDTNKSSATVLLSAPPPAKLPTPISPVSAYSAASPTSSRVQSPTRSTHSSRSGLAKWPPPPPSMKGSGTDAAQSLSPPNSPRRWPSIGGGSDSAASSINSVPSLVRRANSPSITNLSRLSVVKGRLAQLERSLSEQSQAQGDSSEHGLVIARTKSSRSRSSSKVRDEPGEAVIKSVGTGKGDGEAKSKATRRDLSPRGGKDKEDRDSEGKGQHEGVNEEEVDRREDASRTSSALASYSNAAGFGSSLKQVNTSSTTDGLPTTTSPPTSKAKGSDSDWSSGDPDMQQKRVLDGIASIRSVLGQRDAGPGDGLTIQQVTLGLDHRLKGANETLKEVKSTLHVIEKRLEKAQRQGPSPGPELSERHEEMLHLLKAVKAQLAANIPGLEAKISELAAQQKKMLAGNPRMPASESALDLGPIQRQLDNLIELSSSTQAIMKAGALSKDVRSEISRLISLMEGDRAHREQQLMQQADSVRYLNELNTWLEAFVNNGASHIQGLAASIDKLCADLGPVTIADDGTDSSSPNLLNDVRSLVLGMKARDQNMASLQAALNDLIVAIGSETRSGADTAALARLMETQKRNQESMLKAFTDEISDEIKGERLRFVEAMKEATAINVQLHVEQLKKEMGKEVFVMAKEVGRLHRDKQEVELRIADLMAFYSKQQQLSSSDTQNAMTSMQPVADLRMKPLVSGHGHGGHATSRSHRRQTAYVAATARPLPLPRGSY